MRLEFQTPHMDIPHAVLERSFEEAVAQRYGMQWSISYASRLKKMAILVSKNDHVLLELLWRCSRGELPARLVQVISNHPDCREAVEAFGVAFHYVPVEPATKKEAESRILELLEGQTDMLVLARYMQVLSQEFVAGYVNRIINIHHSFLPAFVGASPYQQACERGVKLIGATAHYVTAKLDDGPIIEQDVERVSHRFSIAELKELGRDIERTVLARAVKWHLEDRIIIHGNKTVVFI